MTEQTDLRGRRLLLLGGDGPMAAVTAIANAMGIHTVVADWHEDTARSPAKALAADAWTVSWNDIDTLSARCREEHIDGIFTAFSEGRILSAARLCERLGLPFYASSAQIDLVRDKRRFRTLCHCCDVPVVPAYDIPADFSDDDLNGIPFPLVVKPTDNAGGRGISLCRNADELRRGIDGALKNSECKDYLVEAFQPYPEITVSYTARDGEISFSCMSDAAGTPGQPDGWLFPSKYLPRYIQTADTAVRGMLQTLGFRNGFAFLQAFYDGAEFRFFEMGLRPGGGMTYALISANGGPDYMKMLLRYSLTGQMGAGPADDPSFHGTVACNLVPVGRPGRLAAIADAEKIRALPGVVSVRLSAPGTDIPDASGTIRNLGRVNITADDPAQLWERIACVYDALDARHADGGDMLSARLMRERVLRHWEA